MEKQVITHFEERLREGKYLSRRNPQIFKGLKGWVLEVGCGTTASCTTENCELIGLDISRSMIRKFKECNRVEAICGDVRFLPFQQCIFSTVISISLLHHLVGDTFRQSKKNIERTLKELRRILKKDGCIQILEDTALNNLFTLIMYFFTLLCAKLNIQINVLDVHSQVITFFMSEIEYEMFTRVNLVLTGKKIFLWKMRRIILGKTIWFTLKGA